MLIANKKARLNYEVLETFEAGIKLLGFEVKALKQKSGSLEGSHVTIRGAEAFVINMHIPPYQPTNTPKGYDPYRNRKLLLTKKELLVLTGKESQKGLTMVPLSVYNKGKNIKLEFAIVRGKKKFDKREDLKKQTAKRDIERSLKYE